MRKPINQQNEIFKVFEKAETNQKYEEPDLIFEETDIKKMRFLKFLKKAEADQKYEETDLKFEETDQKYEETYQFKSF